MASGLSFAKFFTSRFDRIAGNFGDARLVIYLQEHWYNRRPAGEGPRSAPPLPANPGHLGQPR